MAILDARSSNENSRRSILRHTHELLADILCFSGIGRTFACSCVICHVARRSLELDRCHLLSLPSACASNSLSCLAVTQLCSLVSACPFALEHGASKLTSSDPFVFLFSSYQGCRAMIYSDLQSWSCLAPPSVNCESIIASLYPHALLLCSLQFLFGDVPANVEARSGLLGSLSEQRESKKVRSQRSLHIVTSTEAFKQKDNLSLLEVDNKRFVIQICGLAMHLTSRIRPVCCKKYFVASNTIKLKNHSYRKIGLIQFSSFYCSEKSENHLDIFRIPHMRGHILTALLSTSIGKSPKSLLFHLCFIVTRGTT